MLVEQEARLTMLQWPQWIADATWLTTNSTPRHRVLGEHAMPTRLRNLSTL